MINLLGMSGASCLDGGIKVLVLVGKASLQSRVQLRGIVD
jgi:hypothetical protein